MTNDPRRSSRKCPDSKDRPFVIPVFLPQAGCPHQCVFCNQGAITGKRLQLPESREMTPDFLAGYAKREIDRHLEYRRDARRQTEISFYGGNFLGLEKDAIRRLLETAAEYVRAGVVHGIRFSTRPDTVNRRSLALLSGYPVHTVELGVQSMDDSVLERSARGHSAKDSILAASLLKEASYRTGLQMMVGLPGESGHSAMETARSIISLAPNFVRIYPVLVVRGSPLEHLYRRGQYEPVNLERCIARVKDLFALFLANDIPVVRIGLQANTGFDSGGELVAGPYHPALGQMVVSGVLFDRAAKAIEALGIFPDKGAHVHVHPRMISTLRGQKNANIRRLERLFPGVVPIRVVPDPDAGYYDVSVTRT